ncbi:60S ribosomal protein L6E like protein [Aduncisulcus paluster]|uniref:60S ribosomal protein L6E like protein n=1 Tax=Aduncisulcus paluster TaxID=2918883 RepID=A0ABQ5JZE1_9EUKA|nr:60S ribosomal protein L6E like protein [Aduncisulcus paluster]|eukprot:gnl/Carplike_NY0171/124_a177_6759.p1 GENE.gnl/Carplike_NY0171/124_a177_6759~~gnl/Carplike_NY0171/124_a177_6759.p1  ORF type:complete len:160 (+),score=49.98 gnl/Carplike_NY0171/124_a177_6759:34-513(+)
MKIQRFTVPRPTHKASSTGECKAHVRPGQVVIILSGGFAGKRVVALKNLPRGFLLVSGPYKINGVPLRRVPASRVIPTSTLVDISKIDLSQVSDALFKKEKKGRKVIGKRSASFENFCKVQSTVDTQILSALKDQPLLKKYLDTKFSLVDGDKPHEMKF